MQFTTIFSASVALLAAQAQAAAINHTKIHEARQLPDLGSLTGALPGVGGLTGGLPGVGGLTGALPGVGGLTGAPPAGAPPATGVAPPATSEPNAPSTDGSGNTYFCCSTPPGGNPTLLNLQADINCPMIPVLTIVEFYNTCSNSSQQVICSPSQDGESNDGILNSQCTVQVPISIS